jgi:predicted glycosyltransferase
MENLKDTIQQELEKIWPQAKKNISKFQKDVVGLMEKSEKDIAVISKKVKTNIDKLVSQAKREELYYELGKNVAPLLTSDQLKNKNILRITAEIRLLTKNLRKK